MVGLLLVVGIALVFAAAFWWFMPREKNDGDLTTMGDGYWGRGSDALEVDRRLRRAQSAADAMEQAQREWDRDLPSEADLERFGEGRGDDAEER